MSGRAEVTMQRPDWLESAWARWAMVLLFAAAMAWMESATVTYLRLLVGRVQPYQPDPLPLFGGLGRTEMIREAATMVMLAFAGCLGGRNARTRFALFLLAFGVWDLLYYAFLPLMCGWPRSLMDWDCLFLLPLPWWGPVLAPASIAALMVLGGSLIALGDRPERPLWPRGWAWFLNGAGAVLALYVFMADAIRASASGPEAVRRVLPQTFEWPLFLLALAAMAAPVIDAAWQLRRPAPAPAPEPAPVLE